MELKTIGMTKKFSSKTAVDNLNITLTNGVYGLLGANGAGKTTLMRLLCNIQNPTSGRILLNEKNIVGLGERYRNLLGYLPQHFGYYPDFSAYDFLRYVSALKGLDEKAAHKKSKELLEAVDLSRESKHKIKTFSGGMKQRLGIAQGIGRFSVGTELPYKNRLADNFVLSGSYPSQSAFRHFLLLLLLSAIESRDD